MMRKALTKQLAIAWATLVLSILLGATGEGMAQNGPSPAPLGAASAAGAMAVYKDFTKYPPESRPLNRENWDLLHPWSVDASTLPLVPLQVMRQVETLRASGMSEEDVMGRVTMPSSLPRYRLEMNRTIVTGTRDRLEARLIVTPERQSDATLRLRVSKAELIGDPVFGSLQLGSVPFFCEAGAAACTFTWSAPSSDNRYWGTLQLVVTLAIEGMADDFVIHQNFYSSPMVAGRFTGRFQERLENGSLVIDAAVQVQKRMACFVSANLFSVDEAAPTHHVERRMIVDPSMQTVSFTFFGKIFRDSSHEGTFRLQDLKAQCENLAYPPEWFIDSLAHRAELEEFQRRPPAKHEPARIYFAYNDYSFTTQQYSSGSFSDQEWQSPERTRKLEMFKKAATDLDNPEMDLRKRQLLRGK
jgi:hypothetical protein